MYFFIKLYPQSPASERWDNYKEPTPILWELRSGRVLQASPLMADSGSKKRLGWYPPCQTRFFITPSRCRDFFFIQYQTEYQAAFGRKYLSLKAAGLSISMICFSS